MLGAFLCHMSTGAATISVDTEDAAPTAWFALRGRNLRSPCSPGTSPGSRQQDPKAGKERKSEGAGGAADSGVLLVLLWEYSSTVTGGEGLRGGGGKGHLSLSAGFETGAPRASTRRCPRPAGEGRRVVPAGQRDLCR